MGHALIENRHGLVVDSRLTQATGKAEREAATDMICDLKGTVYFHLIRITKPRSPQTQKPPGLSFPKNQGVE